MTTALRAASRRRKLSIRLHRWHRRIGVLASLFLIWMSVSGWLLNHTDALALGRSNVHASWLAQRYGIKTELPERALVTAQHWLVALPAALVLDGKPLVAAPIEPLGMVESQALLFIASATQLQIFSAAGAPIDTIPTALLPIAHIERIGSGCAGVVIADAKQLFASSDGTDWQLCAAAVVWSTSAPLSVKQKQIIEPIAQPGISIERLLLDLHSGRFWGAWGPYFVDALAFGLVLLALSGLWMFAQQRRRRRQRLHH